MAARVVVPVTAFATSRRAREVEPVHAPDHLAWIRSLPSVVSGQYGCEAAHINFADHRYGKPERAKGKKADDRWVLPLTPDEHRNAPDAQHKTGKERAWWDGHGIDATTLANDLWRVSGNTEQAIIIICNSRRGGHFAPRGAVMQPSRNPEIGDAE